MDELLDAIEKNRKVLKHQFYFRLTVFIVSVICFSTLQLLKHNKIA